MFGRGFTLRDKTVNGVGAAVSGGSHAGPHTKEMGYIAYFEVRITLKKKHSCLSYVTSTCRNRTIRGAVVVVIVWWLDLQLTMQLVPITTNAVRSNPAHSEVYSIQHYVYVFLH
jgi:hypothetical protein